MICESLSKSAVWVCPSSGGGCLTVKVNVPVGTTITGCPVGQSLSISDAEFAALKSSSAASSPASLQVNVSDAFGTATPEEYQALLTVFAAALTVGAVIWGAKRLLQLFGSHVES